MDKRAKELVAELNEIGDALWSTNALRGSQVNGVARRLEQALATLEQPDILAEAEWWAAAWNGGMGLCPESINCSDCDEPRKRILALRAVRPVTLEQSGNDPEYLTALESGLDNETQEQFIERTGIVQQPSVRPVTGNAPKVRLTEDQVRSALIVAGDYCGMSHVRLQTEELNRILALAGTPDQANLDEKLIADLIESIVQRNDVRFSEEFGTPYYGPELEEDVPEQAELPPSAKEPRS